MAAISLPQTDKMRLNQPIKQADLAVVCALLHDTIEDTFVTFQDIANAFDEQTAYCVFALSKDKNWPTKREQLLDSLYRIKQQAREISMVKLADRITNLQPPSKHWSKEKINDHRDEVKIILEELGHSNEHLAQSLDDNRDLLIPGMYIVLKMHLCKVVDTTFGCKTDKDIMVPRIKQLR